METFTLLLTLVSILSVGTYVVISALAAIAYHSTERVRDKRAFGLFFSWSLLLLSLSTLCVVAHVKGYRVLNSEVLLLFVNNLLFVLPFLGVFLWAKLCGTLRQLPPPLDTQSAASCKSRS
jgi:hypothetical protein